MKDLKAFALALPLLVLPSWSLAQEPSHAMLPARMPHYNVMKGETILQFHGIGPYDIQYVNAADDPSRKAPER
jgi:hypothetical protein